jgi:rhodanese-related sulfurtransferase
MNNKYPLFITIILIIGLVVFWNMTDNNSEHMMDTEHHEDEMVEAHEIYPADVAQKIEDGEDIVLLDVRTAEEYAEVHLEGALLLPVQELSAQTLTDIGLGENMKDKEIIIYCRSGARSKTAYDIMTSLGYTNIKSSAGGMVHWEEDNYPFTEVGEYDGKILEENTQTQTSGPKITLDHTLHKFGVITQFGGTVEATFIVKNEGTEMLEIGDITTSCSCTSASISSSAILAGGQAELTVVFDPDFHEEPVDVFKRTVFIPTNDPANPEMEVAIEVDIDEGK